jgi:hypothetical protein
MDRILDRMERVHRGRDHLERDFDRDVRRTPMWQLLGTQNRGGVQEDFRKLYGAVRSMGMEIQFGPDRDHRRTGHMTDDHSWVCELRYGHRLWSYRFSPRLMESSADAQHHMIETICTGAQQLFMEVALDNVLDNDHSVMPYRNRPGGNALRYEASQRITFEDLDRNPPLTMEPTPNVHPPMRPPARRDRPGFHSVIRPAEYRVPPPTTAELRASAGADLHHLAEQVDHLDDVPDTPFGPSESALEQSYRV